jgi:hypothetical protein
MELAWMMVNSYTFKDRVFQSRSRQEFLSSPETFQGPIKSYVQCITGPLVKVKAARVGR